MCRVSVECRCNCCRRWRRRQLKMFRGLLLTLRRRLHKLPAYFYQTNCCCFVLVTRSIFLEDCSVAHTIVTFIVLLSWKTVVTLSIVVVSFVVRVSKDTKSIQSCSWFGVAKCPFSALISHIVVHCYHWNLVFPGSAIKDCIQEHCFEALPVCCWAISVTDSSVPLVPILLLTALCRCAVLCIHMLSPACNITSGSDPCLGLVGFHFYDSPLWCDLHLLTCWQCWFTVYDC